MRNSTPESFAFPRFGLKQEPTEEMPHDRMMKTLKAHGITAQDISAKLTPVRPKVNLLAASYTPDVVAAMLELLLERTKGQ